MRKGDFLGIYVAIAIVTFFLINSAEVHTAKTVMKSALWPITVIEYLTT